MSFALSESSRSTPEVDPGFADGGPAVSPRPALVPIVAAVCGIAAVAAIKLVQVWLAQAPILDFRL
jgi:hypothetical protein